MQDNLSMVVFGSCQSYDASKQIGLTDGHVKQLCRFVPVPKFNNAGLRYLM